MDIDKEKFHSSVSDILSHPLMQESKKYVQHGNVSVYTHSYMVSAYSYKLAKKFKSFDLRSLARGAMLHDFFLYDWHIKRYRELHGFNHPRLAAINANEHFDLNRRENDIIRHHMWPLTLRSMPKCRESWLVCMVDKYCSLLETLHLNRYNDETLSIS